MGREASSIQLLADLEDCLWLSGIRFKLPSVLLIHTERLIRRSWGHYNSVGFWLAFGQTVALITVYWWAGVGSRLVKRQNKALCFFLQEGQAALVPSQCDCAERKGVSSAHLRCFHNCCIVWHTASANSLHHVCKKEDAALHNSNLHVSAPGVSLFTFKDIKKKHIFLLYAHRK